MFKFIGPTSLFGDRISEANSNRVAQLTIEYVKSPLTVEYLGRGGVRAGMRAPDAKVVRAVDKKTISLFDLLYRYNNDWTLLAFDGGKESDPISTLQQIGNRIAKTFCKIRPYLVISVLENVELIDSMSSVLLDVDRFAHMTFELDQSALILVRPDGYIGFRGGREDEQALEDYCRKIFFLVDRIKCH